MKLSTLFLLTLIFFCGSLSAQYSRGLLPEGDDEYAKLPERTPLVTRSYTVMPPRFSMRQNAPRPRNQGGNGNCTGWAAGYCARTIIEARRRGWTDRDQITRNAYSPGFTFLQGGGGEESCTGAFNSPVVRSLASLGAVRNAEIELENGTTECPKYPIPMQTLNAARANRIPFPLTLWGPAFTDAYAKIIRTKRAVSAGHPVVISMVAPKSFEGVDAGGTVGSDGRWIPEAEYPSAEDCRTRCHAVTVVGYDDDRRR